MKVTLLGTGDAIGTPKIGCSCPRCTYARETGAMRLRTSLLLEHNGHHVLIDSSPDLRQQLLLQGSPKIDAVIWTHGHYDHFMGYGEFYRVQPLPPVYAAPPVLWYCGGIFGFLSFPRHPVEPFTPFSLFGMTVTLILVNHPPVLQLRPGRQQRDESYRLYRRYKGSNSCTEQETPGRCRPALR